VSKITVTVSGETGSGKSAIVGEIEIALKAIGVPVTVAERDTMVVADYQYWINLYKPEVTIVEHNIPVAAHPTEGGKCYSPEVPSWVDAAALQAAREIAALAGPVPAYQKIAAIQTIVAREMMRARRGGRHPQSR